MTQDEYATRRQVLDRQLEAGIELLRQAHHVQVRALEMVWTMSPEAAGAVPGRVASFPEVGKQPVAPPAPAPAQPPAPAKPKREAWAVYDDVCDALEKVGPQFVRADVVRALGYEPERSSLHRALLELQREGAIKLVEPGSGRVPSRWAKAAQATAESAQGS